LGAYITPIVEALYYQGLFHDHGKPFVQLMGNLFLLSGFGGITHWDWTLNEPAWSISIEFFAYLFLFPPLVFLFKKYDREKILYVVILPATFGMLLCYAPINHIIINWNWTRFARGFFGFPLGFLLCMMFKRSEIKSRIAVDAVGLMAIGIIFLALYSLLPQILILCVLPFLVYFTAFDQGYLCHFLNTPVNQWLGERSYSIYLWHIPFMYVYFIPMRDAIDSMIKIPRAYYGLSNIIIVITGVMIISELSYRYFENPIRRIFLQRGIVNA
jgi:peptidoglycan/LPS O-acetylase OafA/YrhL